MKEKLSNRKLLFTIGVLLLGVLIYLGYTRYLNLRYMESELNNRYENSFQNMNTHLDSLERELGMVLLSTTDDNLSTNLSKTWRSAYSAHQGIGEIPIGSDTLDNTKSILDKIMWYSEHLDDDIEEKDGLVEEEVEMVSQLKTKIGSINEEIEEIDTQMKREGFSWNDKKRVELDLDEEDFEGTALLGMVNLDNNLDLPSVREEFQNIGIEIEEVLLQESDLWADANLAQNNQNLSEEEALERASEFIEKHNEEEYQYEIFEADETLVEGEEVENEMPAYAVEAVNTNDRRERIYVDISREHGKILNYLKHRDIGEKQLDREVDIEDIEEMLSDAGYEDLVISNKEEYDDLLIINLVPEIDNIKIKSNLVNVELALDDGELISFIGNDYFLHQEDRKIEEYATDLNINEAKKHVKELLEIEKKAKILIKNANQERILCYEFVGSLENDENNSYIIRIDANTGEEKEIDSKKEDMI